MKGLLDPRVLLVNCLTCALGGLFFSPSTGLGIQLITDSACEASLNAGGCWLIPLIKLGIAELTKGMAT